MCSKDCSKESAFRAFVFSDFAGLALSFGPLGAAGCHCTCEHPSEPCVQAHASFGRGGFLNYPLFFQAGWTQPGQQILDYWAWATTAWGAKWSKLEPICLHVLSKKENQVVSSLVLSSAYHWVRPPGGFAAKPLQIQTPSKSTCFFVPPPWKKMGIQHHDTALVKKKTGNASSRGPLVKSP